MRRDGWYWSNVAISLGLMVLGGVGLYLSLTGRGLGQLVSP